MKGEWATVEQILKDEKHLDLTISDSVISNIMLQYNLSFKVPDFLKLEIFSR